PHACAQRHEVLLEPPGYLLVVVGREPPHLSEGRRRGRASEEVSAGQAGRACRRGRRTAGRHARLDVLDGLLIDGEAVAGNTHWKVLVFARSVSMALVRACSTATGILASASAISTKARSQRTLNWSYAARESVSSP